MAMEKQRAKDTQAGRIGRLKEETKAFYRNLTNFILEETDDANKADYLCSIFDKLCEEAVPVSQNQSCSHTVEGLLPMADSQQLCRLFVALGQDWATVTTDRCAGHVLQTVLSLLPKCFQPGGEKGSSQGEGAGGAATSQAAEVKSCLDSLCQHFQAQLPELALQTYSSHVLRVLLELLAGVAVSEKVVRSRASRFHQREKLPQLKVPGPWRRQMWEWFTKLTKKIFKTCDFDEHLVDASFNPVVQTVLLILQQKDETLLHKYCKKLLKRISKTQSATEEEEEEEEEEDGERPDQQLPWLVRDEVGSYLGQLLMQMALPPDMAAQRDAVLLQGQLLSLTIHPTANFVLNSYLANVSSAEQAKAALEKLLPALETILGFNAVQVVISLADICHRLKTCQKKFVKRLMAAFHCLKPPERQRMFIPLVATMSTYEVLCGAPEKDGAEEEGQKKKKEHKEKAAEVGITHVTTPGSLLLQSLLKFEDSDLVVSGVASLPASDLFLLATDPAGSHALDAFFQSPALSPQHVQQVAGSLKGQYADLACSKHGSFLVEALWRQAALPLRKEIAFQLSQEHARLQSSRSGYIVYRKLFLEKFRHNQKVWMQMQQHQQQNPPRSQKRKFQPGAAADSQGRNKRRRKNKTGQN